MLLPDIPRFFGSLPEAVVFSNSSAVEHQSVLQSFHRKTRRQAFLKTHSWILLPYLYAHLRLELKLVTGILVIVSVYCKS